MRRFSMLARHVIGLVALALALLTFGSGSMSTTVAAPSGDKGRIVAANDEGTMRSSVSGTTEDGRHIRAGKFTPESFAVEDGTVTVTGTLEGFIPGEGRFSETITTTVESINGTAVAGAADAGSMNLASSHGCEILFLELGPLELNLLGLQVDLSQITLEIVAQPGPGNLLGNLLCEVAGLLDGGLQGLLQRLVNLLNQILGQLGLGI